MTKINSISKNGRLYGLDHLRAIAIILVLIFHYKYFFDEPIWWPSFVKFGWTGVDLFFVLSGFLITSQLFSQIKQGQKISYKRFFIKRFFRIVPVYLAVIAIYYVFPIVRERDTLPQLWRYLTFTHNFGLDTAVTNAFSHAWSLSIEEHFYILLPLLLIFLQRKKLLKNAFYIIIILFIFGFILRNYLWYNQYLPNLGTENIIPTWTKYIYFPTYNRLDGLLVGVSVAAIYQFLPIFWNKISKYGNLLIILGIGILTFTYFFCSDLVTYNTSVFGFPLIAIGYGFLVLGAISPNSFLFKWNSKISTFIAALSYGIYLIHKVSIHVAQKVFSDLGVDSESGLMVIISAISCVLMAWILYLTVEKPFMKVRKSVLNNL